MVKSQNKDIVGKIPPQAIDVEEAVLGALMLERDAFSKIDGIINSDSFYKVEHQHIFRTIKKLASQHKPIDLLTITVELRNTNELDNVGGPLFVTQLTNRVASAAHIEYHARIIAQQAIKREIISVATSLVQLAYDPNNDLDDIINDLKQKSNQILEYSQAANVGKLQNIVCHEAITEIEEDCRKAEMGISPGITTGLRELDKAIGGWRKTNLIIIAARPAVGKTSLTLYFAKIAAKAGYWVNFFGLEMKATDMMRIMLAGEASIPRTHIRDGKLNSSDWQRINVALSQIENIPILWHDVAGITSTQIKSITSRNVKAGKCDLVIIDYIQLIKPLDMKANREQQVAEISRTLKEIALSENIPVICLSQLSRGAEADNAKPALYHLRESGALEQDADVVIFPSRKDDRYTLQIMKNRRGKVGGFKIFANDELTAFDNHFKNDETDFTNQGGAKF